MAEITLNFTEHKLSKLISAKKLTTYKDDKCKYLKLNVYPSGRKSYFFRTKHNNKDVKRKLGEVGQLPLVNARILAEGLKEQYHIASQKHSASNESCLERNIKASDFLTLTDIFELYLHNELSQKSTIAGRKHGLEVAYRRHVEAQFGALQVKELNKKLARDICRSIEDKGYSVHNKVLTVLRAAFHYVIDFEESLSVLTNPFERIKKMTGTVRNRYLSYEEASRLLSALDQVDNQDVADIYRCALYTGARLSNVKQMQWNDLNLVSANWLIPATNTKTKQHYDIPLHDKVIELLLERQKTQKQSPYVFASHSGKYGYITGGDNVWKQAIKLAGLYHENPNIRPRPHDLRRTFATWQIQSGADISVVSKALCHTSLKHTLIYAHTNTRQVRTSINDAFKLL